MKNIIVTTLCGARRSRIAELSISSFLYFSPSTTIHVLTDGKSFIPFENRIVKHNLKNSTTLNNGGSPCLCARYEIYKLFYKYRYVLYVDIDVIATEPIEPLFQIDLYNKKWSGATLEAEKGKYKSWYQIKGKKDIVPPSGINSGVWLVNVKRMKDFNVFIDYMKYKKKR